MESTLGTIDTSSQGAIETFRFDPTNEELIVEIAEAVASVSNTDVLEFTPRIHDVIDADALTRCLCSADETLRVAFTLGTYRVTATGCGRLYVSELR